jgi:hypothetical protein
MSTAFLYGDRNPEHMQAIMAKPLADPRSCASRSPGKAANAAVIR